MSDRLKKLLDERAKAWAEAQDIRERVEREENRDLTTEENETYNRALDDCERLDGDIRNEERHGRLEAIEPPAPQAQTPEARDEAADYEQAFAAMLRRGVGDVTSEQRALLQRNFVQESRAQSVGTDTAGGYTVPEGFRNTMTEAMKAYGGLLGVVNVITTSSGNDLVWPTNDDTSNKGAILSENTQVSEGDFTFGQAELKAYTYTSKMVRVSLQLLQDSAFNLDQWLPSRLGVRIGRAVAEHVATGSGTNQPKGIDNCSTTVTAAGTTAVKYDELVDLEHKVDPAYRARAQYVLSDGALAMIRKLKDSNNRMLWQPSLAPGVPSTINGHAYVVDNDLAAPAAGAVVAVFGDLNAGYIGRQVSGAQVLRLAERYADYLQVGFLAFSRFDGTIDDDSAIASLTMASA